MATYNKFQQCIEDIYHGVHNFSADNLEVALCNAANAPSASLDAVLTDLVVISYTNLSSRVITTSSSGHTTGTYDLVLNDLTLSASGGAVAGFRYVVVFNQDSVTPTDALICWFDYGSDLVLNDGESLTVDFESDGPTTGSLFTAT
jgi:hypothetical protein